MPPSNIDANSETSILYEISLSIGSSLNLDKMLRTVLSKMQRGLNCNGAMILRPDKDTKTKWQTISAIPKNLPRDADVQNILNSAPMNNSDSPNPLTLFTQENKHYYLFTLPDFGWLLLRKATGDFSLNLQASLSKMMPKLSHACLSCLHEQNLRQQMKTAEAASIAKSRFLARMSHEIRTPMNGVLGMLALVLNTSLTREQKEQLQLAELSASNLLHIINNILDLSRIEAGKFDYYPEATDLFLLVGTCTRALAPTAWSKGLVLNYVIHPKLPRFVITDASRIRQLLNNLLGNAIKFTHEGSVVLEVSANFDIAMPKLIFEIRDTGIGIDSSRLASIFKPFEQVDDGTNRKYEGTGLGLAITKEIIESMGGTVNAESEPGVGSRFYFTLPMSICESPGHHSTLNQTCDCMFEHIVPAQPNSDPDIAPVIDPTVQQLLKGLEVCYSIKTFKDAMKPCQETVAKPGIVMMDCDHFIGTSGTRIMQKTLQKNPCMRLVLYYSGNQPELINDPTTYDRITVLQKPFTIDELGSALKACLQIEGAQATQSVDVYSEESQPSLSLLVVDDNDINLVIATSLLQNSGYQTQVAHNGEEALDILARHEFDAVFMDVMMPIMDGFEATKVIRQREQELHLRHTPIIAMTANAMRGDKEQCLACGMDGYVSKPVAMDEIQKQLSLLVAQTSNNF